jgi:hypothetical protein
LWRDLEEAKKQLLWGLSQADVVKISDEEVEFLFGLNAVEGARHILEHYGVELVFVTCGANGCVFKNEIAEGYKHWQTFLEKSQRGEDAFLRTVHVMLGNVFVYDLYYSNGKYTVYELNYGEVSEGKSFSLLRCLDGMNGEETERIYVLTDDPELTYDEVKLKYHVSSSIYAYSQSDFYWMIFLTHFE